MVWVVCLCSAHEVFRMIEINNSLANYAEDLTTMNGAKAIHDYYLCSVTLVYARLQYVTTLYTPLAEKILDEATGSLLHLFIKYLLEARGMR
jgi:hypothetical protein